MSDIKISQFSINKPSIDFYDKLEELNKHRSKLQDALGERVVSEVISNFEEKISNGLTSKYNLTRSELLYLKYEIISLIEESRQTAKRLEKLFSLFNGMDLSFAEYADTHNENLDPDGE